MDKTKVIYMDADSLIPYANNPRLNDNAVDAVAASIKELGFKVPIVVDGENVIINGHTRLKAAHKLGLTQVPVIVADDLTPAQVKAFRLADNKTSELAEWDLDKLDIELDGIDEIDMGDFGFDVEIDYDAGTQPDQNLQEDGFCEDDVPQRVQRGDVWVLGSHRLMCGDLSGTRAAEEWATSLERSRPTTKSCSLLIRTQRFAGSVSEVFGALRRTHQAITYTQHRSQWHLLVR